MASRTAYMHQVIHAYNTNGSSSRVRNEWHLRGVILTERRAEERDTPGVEQMDACAEQHTHMGGGDVAHHRRAALQDGRQNDSRIT